MTNNKTELLVALILLSIYLLSLIVLKFIFKIKRTKRLDKNLRKSLPKYYSYIYAALLVLGLIQYLLFNKSINLLLIVLLGDQLVLSSLLLKKTKGTSEKYYDYFSIIFSSIGIILLILDMLFY